MPPTLILIRHAQALHNVDQDYTIPDPDLSELGREQCKNLRDNLTKKLQESDVDLILVSPMRRTIQTALHSLDFLIEKGVPIHAHASWQENSDQPCDVGSPIPALEAEFPMVHFGSVDPVYPDKTSPAGTHYATSKSAILGRAKAALDELYHRPEKTIAVVSHSSFLRQGVCGYWFFNADYRIFDMEEKKEPTERVKLKQREETAAGGLGWSLPDPVVIGEGLDDA